MVFLRLTIQWWLPPLLSTYHYGIDFLVAYSTIHGYTSHGEDDEGSWYIQCLCDVLESDWQKYELPQMLKETNRKMAYEKSFILIVLKYYKVGQKLKMAKDGFINLFNTYYFCLNRKILL